MYFLSFGVKGLERRTARTWHRGRQSPELNSTHQTPRGSQISLGFSPSKSRWSIISWNVTPQLRCKITKHITTRLQRSWKLGSISNFPCSFARNITSHSMGSISFSSLTRVKDEDTTNSHYLAHTILFRKAGRIYYQYLNLGVKI